MRKIVSLLLAFIFLFSVVHLTVFADNEENTNLLSEADSTFESGETNWNIFTAGELSFVDNPKGEGKVMKYQVDTDAYTEKNNTWQSCIIDLKPFIKEANTIYIAMDIVPLKIVGTKLGNRAGIYGVYCIAKDNL